MHEAIPVHRALHPLNAIELKHAPGGLHMVGDGALLTGPLRVSVVGSRVATLDQLALARDVARVIVSLGGVVVSGLAKGIDAAAHSGAIEAGGRTVAVLGNALDRFYPAENRDLQHQLMRDHLVVSQFAPGQNPGQTGFIARNRTMALLSHATVIIAASEQSGTRHQAWEAVRLGRGVMMHRTLIDARLEWAQKMLDYNAIVFEAADDLACEPYLNPRAAAAWERETPDTPR